MKEAEDSTMQRAWQQVPVTRYGTGQSRQDEDPVTVEVPVELVLEYGPASGRKRQRITVNLLTPTELEDWATGFLFAEGIIGRAEAVESVSYGNDRLLVQLSDQPEYWRDLSLNRTARKLAATASCGFCGKADLDGVHWTPAWFPAREQPRIQPAVLTTLDERLRSVQTVFSQTGGLHAAALFDAAGKLLLVREDIGRHNALDKLLGAALRADHMPLRSHILWLSGRVGFELVQKASMAGIPVITAVGAPSSMSVQSADLCGITLIGFLRGTTFNCYCGAERLAE